MYLHTLFHFIKFSLKIMEMGFDIRPSHPPPPKKKHRISPPPPPVCGHLNVHVGCTVVGYIATCTDNH